MHPLPFRGYLCAVASVVLLLAMPEAQASIIYTTAGSEYSQSFDSLITTGTLVTFANNSTLPGWYGFSGTTGTVNSTIINANNGSGVIGGLQSYGNTSDRAFGSLSSSNGATAQILAVAFNNSTTAPLDSFIVSYDGEQWRKGQAGAQNLAFAFGFGSSYASVNTWVNVPSLNFTSPVANPNLPTALNGNLAANRRADINATISGLDWMAADTLWLRWVDAADPGSSDHGMGIDNFRFSATAAASAAVPEPSSMLLMSVVGIAGFGYRRLRHRSEKVCDF